MTWIWATLLLVLAAPFVLWPMVRAEPPQLDDEDGTAPPGE
ncbi:MAG: hypothetical protein ACREQM_23680 [Candidatus Dormibacteraceae bacterium]